MVATHSCEQAAIAGSGGVAVDRVPSDFQIARAVRGAPLRAATRQVGIGELKFAGGAVIRRHICPPGSLSVFPLSLKRPNEKSPVLMRECSTLRWKFNRSIFGWAEENLPRGMDYRTPDAIR
jgi:hypothetical protein